MSTFNIYFNNNKVKPNFKKELHSFLKLYLNQFKWNIISDNKKAKDADFIINSYNDIIKSPLEKKLALSTSFPNIHIDSSINLKLGLDGFVFTFKRKRTDIINSFCMYFGKVDFIGAGAGHKELISVKGMRTLKLADVVIYDKLLDPNIITSYTNQDALTIPLTKYGNRTKKNLVSQSQINEAILRYALLFKHVVRLKGGDSFIFGRGGEECEYILPFNIKFEVIPGISSIISALCYSGIPLTHRDYNHGFIAITGYNKQCSSPQSFEKCNQDIANKINFALENNLMVVLFMSLNNWMNFKNLIALQNTPLALIESGAYPNQKTFISTVKNANTIIEKHKLKSPTLIAIGKNTSIHHKLHWFDKLPLFNIRIIAFASQKLAPKVYDAFAPLGASIKCLSLYSLIPQKQSITKQYLTKLNLYDYIFITSTNAFYFLIDALKSLNIDLRALPKIIVSGQKTASHFKQIGLIPDIIPKSFSSKGIIEAIKSIDIKNKKFLFPKSSLSDGSISTFIKSQNAFIDEFILYHNKSSSKDHKIINCIPLFKPHYVIFTSSSSVNIFYEKLNPDYDNFIPVSMGDKTTASLKKKFKLKQILVPNTFTIQSIKDSILKHAKTK